MYPGKIVHIKDAQHFDLRFKSLIIDQRFVFIYIVKPKSYSCSRLVFSFISKGH